jgi:hypothetical protein
MADMALKWVCNRHTAFRLEWSVSRAPGDWAPTTGETWAPARGSPLAGVYPPAASSRYPRRKVRQMAYVSKVQNIGLD